MHTPGVPLGQREGGHLPLKTVIGACIILLASMIAGPARAADTNTIILRITTTDGTPLVGSFGYTPEGDVERGPFPTDESGVGTISGLADGTYHLRADSAGYLTEMDQPVSLSGGQTVEVVIRLTKGGAIHVENFNGLGSPMVFSTSTPPVRWWSSTTSLYTIDGLPPGDYKVLLFTHGEVPNTFKRAWYGGGLLMSSGSTVRVNQQQTVVVQATQDMPDLTELPALPALDVASDSEGFTVTVNDPEGLGLGLGYEVEYREVGQSWRMTRARIEEPARLVNYRDFVASPGDQFEFRVRAYNFGGVWSPPTVTGSAKLSSADNLAVKGAWSPIQNAGLAFSKPARVKKPAVWVEGKKRTLFWAPSENAVRYRVSAKRNKGKWVALKPRWTTKTKVRLKSLKKGAWRFRVLAENPRASSNWSPSSGVYTVR